MYGFKTTEIRVWFVRMCKHIAPIKHCGRICRESKGWASDREKAMLEQKRNSSYSRHFKKLLVDHPNSKSSLHKMHGIHTAYILPVSHFSCKRKHKIHATIFWRNFQLQRSILATKVGCAAFGRAYSQYEKRREKRTVLCTTATK